MNKEVSPKIVALTFGILTLVFLAAFYVIAWQEPKQEPPGDNVATPINVGTSPQAKAGRFTATEFYDYNDPSYYLNPSGDLNLGGNIIAGGSGNIGGNLQVGGIPSWGGKSFSGWVNMPITSGNQQVCQNLSCGSDCGSTCGKTCSKSGCSYIGTYREAADQWCNRTPCGEWISSDPNVSLCTYVPWMESCKAQFVQKTCYMDDGEGGIQSAYIELPMQCLCNCSGDTTNFWVPSFQ